MSAEREPEQTGPVIRDNRRIDPQTFQVREPQSAAAPAPGAPATGTTAEEADTISAETEAEIAELKAQLAERTADLQRLQAEYVNYKRRVDRDRDVVRKGTIENLLKEFLPALDDVRSAREHGDLTGAFKSVGEELERVTGKQGLESYGQKGDPFDPHIHEALLHSHAAGVNGPTCVEILQPGYRVGDRILRPARVAVAEPDPDAPAPAAASDATAGDVPAAGAEEAADEPSDTTGAH